MTSTRDGTAHQWFGPQLAVRAAYLLAILGLMACDAARTGTDFWANDAEYKLVLLGAGVDRPGGDESRSHDSLVVSLRISAVDGDSIRGVYDGAFVRLGLRVGRATPGPQVFAGVARGDSLRLRLTPDATDAGMLLEGRAVGSTVRGLWRTEAGSKNGLFMLTKVN